nr:restriction endonuclease subunit S [Pseudoalteromonas sp. 1CM17D]
MVKLGDIAIHLRNGASIKQSDGSGGLPITRIETIAQREVNLDKCGYAGIDKGDYINYRLEKGDILISHINSEKHLGKCAIFESDRKDIIHGMNLLCFRVNKRAYPKFVHYYLSSGIFLSKLPKITKKSVNQASFTVTHFKELEIPLPPLDEQKRIAAILDKADAIRRKRQQAIQLADDFLRSVFLDMFGDPVTNPKGWEVKSLKDIARIQIGPFGTQLHKEDYIENGIPLINPTHIVKGEIIPKANLTISNEKHASLSEYHLKTGDIVMGRRGEMGRCAIVNSKEEGWMCGTGSLFIRPKQTGVFSEYLNKLLSSQAIKNHLESESQGATMPNLNKTIVGNIKIPVPTDEVLEQFTVIKETFLKTKSSVIDSLNAPLFESLSQKAFAGEL